MKQFMILHCGFEPPSPEQMGEWNAWFESIAGRQVDRRGLRGGNEITSDGVNELPFGHDSITGYTIIEAESLEEATHLAEGCPIVHSTCVYELMGG